MPYKILAINPGSTSTKISVFEDDRLLFGETLRHSPQELEQFATIPEQKDYRRKLVINALEKENFDIREIDAIACRGGLLRPIPGGTYLVNETMVKDCVEGKRGSHASNLGAIVGNEIGRQYNINAYIVDPTVVDEMQPVARYSGHPNFVRKSIFHALNHKAVANRYAKECGKSYNQLNLIVCHMGGGVTIAAHKQGFVVDTTDGLDGEGPFTPERSGTLPVGDLVRACYSGKYTEAEMYSMVFGKGGMMAYMGTNDMKELECRATAGEKQVQELLSAFHYQIAKEIGAMATVLNGMVDGIILTGGVAYGESTVKAISEQVNWIAPVTVYPGEDEMLALASGVLRVLRNEEPVKIY